MNDLLTTLRAHAGNIANTAIALGVSRQTVYNQIDADPAIAEALKKIRETAGKQGDVAYAIGRLKLDPEAIAARVFEQKCSERVAARAVAIEVVAAQTNRAQRDVSHQIASSPTLQRALDRKLPVDETGQEKRDLFPASLTHEQWHWLNTQGRGTAARILSAVVRWPEAPRTTIANPKHTSFLLPRSLKERLTAEAERQEVSPVQLFRAVVDQARAPKRAQAKAA